MVSIEKKRESVLGMWATVEEPTEVDKHIYLY